MFVNDELQQEHEDLADMWAQNLLAQGYVEVFLRTRLVSPDAPKKLSVCRNRSNRVTFPPAVAWVVIVDIGACDFYVCSLGQCRKLLREALARRNRILLSWCMVAHRLNDQRIVLFALVSRVQHAAELRV